MAKIAQEKTGKTQEKTRKVEPPPENPDNSPEENLLENPEDVTQQDVDREWRCLTCGETAPSTSSGYMSLIKHKCSGEKEIRLIVLENGEELASNFKEALAAGLLGKLKEEESPGKESDSSRGALQVTGDNNIRITITLPAIDLARFNIARRTSGSG